MSKKLVNISPSYHSFVEDQLLTHLHLNSVIDYFEDQGRLSRSCLTGVGIVCGFELRWIAGELSITPGNGVTTDGDLLHFFEQREDGTIGLKTDPLTLTHYREFDDSNAKYAPQFWNIPPDPDIQKFTLTELLPADSQIVANGNALQINGNADAADDLDLKNKVLFLYLDCYSKEPGACTALSCDNQGAEQVRNLRVLALTKAQALGIAAIDAIYNEHNWFQLYGSLQQIEAKRVILTAANSASQNTLKQAYYQAIHADNITEDLKNGYDAIFGKFNQPLISPDIDSILGFGNNAIPNDVQYRYDLQKDLIETYGEIRELLLHINVHCCPDIGAFPKHVMLGGIDSSLAIEPMHDTLRHRFYKSPVIGHEDANYKKVLSLVNRASLMVSSYLKAGKGTEIKITPSVSKAELGEKAIPFYYDVTGSFLDSWDYSKTANLRQRFNLSYNSANLAPDPSIQSPLGYNTDEKDFYRIEGQVGNNATDALENILQLKRDYGLDFDCIAYDLNEGDRILSGLVARYPALTHLAGVPVGGTFVLVTVENTVICDLALNCKIIPNTTKIECCPLTECTYPWISSLHYINNLSRSLDGQQSQTKINPTEYLLQVSEYAINGVKLIDGTTLIRIPLSEVLLRRVHAITDALNTRFPQGVVFDFNENQKRFTITRAKGDKYVIKLRDLTLGNANPVYTYSTTGMYRSGKVFRPDAMICRDLREYVPAFYENLHLQIAPVNKDDDYGTYKDKWAAFNLLKENLIVHPFFANRKRMITADIELPWDVQVLLANIIAALNAVPATSDNVPIPIYKLDGDWVNGLWVDNAMLGYYEQNGSSNDDDIIRFINLKEFLHEDRGFTKLSVFIPNREYHSGYDVAINNYRSVADFYFCQEPSGPNAIVLTGDPAGGPNDPTGPSGPIITDNPTGLAGLTRPITTNDPAGPIRPTTDTSGGRGTSGGRSISGSRGTSSTDTTDQ